MSMPNGLTKKRERENEDYFFENEQWQNEQNKKGKIWEDEWWTKNRKHVETKRV